MTHERDFPPEHLVVCELLESVRDNVPLHRREHWQRLIDLIKHGTNDLLLDNSEQKARIYMLEKMQFYQNGNTPETLFLADVRALREEMLRMIDEENRKENDTAQKDA